MSFLRRLVKWWTYPVTDVVGYFDTLFFSFFLSLLFFFSAYSHLLHLGYLLFAPPVIASCISLPLSSLLPSLVFGLFMFTHVDYYIRSVLFLIAIHANLKGIYPPPPPQTTPSPSIRSSSVSLGVHNIRCTIFISLYVIISVHTCGQLFMNLNRVALDNFIFLGGGIYPRSQYQVGGMVQHSI